VTADRFGGHLQPSRDDSDTLKIPAPDVQLTVTPTRHDIGITGATSAVRRVLDTTTQLTTSGIERER